MRVLFVIALWLTCLPVRGQAVREFLFFMRMDGTHQLESGHVTNIWGFAPGTWEGEIEQLVLPSPTIEVEEGDSIVVTVINPSDEGHTIHWHGLDVDQANDGVPHTSQYVLTGDTFTYRFVATHAGNYIYHCHVTTTLHLMMGMYGKVIVRVPGRNEVYAGGPSFTREYSYLGSEMDRSWNDDFMTAGGLNEFAADHYLLDGKSGAQIYADSGMHVQLGLLDTVLMRLMNIGFHMHRYHIPAGISATVVASDGRPVPQAYGATTIDVYPGERYSVLLTTLDSTLVQHIKVGYHELYQLAEIGYNYIPVNTATPPVGVEKPINDWRVFPNPSPGWLMVEGLSASHRVTLVTISGALIWDGPLSGMPVANLAAGWYTLRPEGHRAQSVVISR